MKKNIVSFTFVAFFAAFASCSSAQDISFCSVLYALPQDYKAKQMKQLSASGFIPLASQNIKNVTDSKMSFEQYVVVGGTTEFDYEVRVQPVDLKLNEVRVDKNGQFTVYCLSEGPGGHYSAKFLVDSNHRLVDFTIYEFDKVLFYPRTYDADIERLAGVRFHDGRYFDIVEWKRFFLSQVIPVRLVGEPSW